MQSVERRQAEAVGVLKEVKELTHELRWTIRVLRIHLSARTR